MSAFAERVNSSLLTSKQSVKSIGLEKPIRQEMLKVVTRSEGVCSAGKMWNSRCCKASNLGEGKCTNQQYCGRQYCVCHPRQQSQAANCHILNTATLAGSKRSLHCSGQAKMNLLMMPSNTTPGSQHNLIASSLTGVKQAGILRSEVCDHYEYQPNLLSWQATQGLGSNSR